MLLPIVNRQCAVCGETIYTRAGNLKWCTKHRLAAYAEAQRQSNRRSYARLQRLKKAKQRQGEMA